METVNNVKLVMPGVTRSLVKEGYDPDEMVVVNQFVENMHVLQTVNDDNFTIIIIKDALGHMAVGTSKRHPKDKKNRVRGEMVALSRAVRNAMVSHLEGRFGKV